MKKVFSLGVVLGILIVSCGDDIPTESTVKLPSYEMIRSEFSSPKTDSLASSMSSSDSSASQVRSLIVSFFGVSDNQHFFSRHINSNSPQVEITLPNGDWLIYGIAYSFVMGKDSVLESNEIKCFHQSISLQGIDKQIDLATSSEKCQNIAPFNSSNNEPLPKITFSRIDDSGNSYRDLAINVQALNIGPQSLNESISVISRLSLPVFKGAGGITLAKRCQEFDSGNKPFIFLPTQALWDDAPPPLPAWYEVTGYLDTECAHKYGNDSSRIFFNRSSAESNSILGSFFSVSGNYRDEVNILRWNPEKIGKNQNGCKDNKNCSMGHICGDGICVEDSFHAME
tara:strand:+ start:673 stop:1695 length:1023 start_codon:yes stop_codon:yes gene_type:complete